METGKILVINYRCKVKGIPFNFFFQAELWHPRCEGPEKVLSAAIFSV
jgi:hypothetical protein